MRYSRWRISLLPLVAGFAIPAILGRAGNEASGPAPASTASAASSPAAAAAISPAALHQLAEQSAVDPGSLRKLVKLCDSGNGQACHYAGLLHASAKTGLLNLEQAAGYFQKGCDAGFALSCADAGLLYTSDDSVIKRDNHRAFELMKRGCMLDEMKACYLEGWLYMSTFEFQSNRSNALELFWKACDGGYGKGCLSLAKFYDKKLNELYKPDFALKLYRLACFSGEPEACKQFPLPALPADAPPGSMQAYLGPRGALYAIPGTGHFVVRAADEKAAAEAENEFLHTLPCEPTGRWEVAPQQPVRQAGTSAEGVTAQCSTSKRTQEFMFEFRKVQDLKP